MTNSTNMVLLAGPLTTYADGAFVGRGDMATARQAQTKAGGADATAAPPPLH